MKLLIFVEDPGAANFIAGLSGLAHELSREQAGEPINIRLVATGAAWPYLQALKIPATVLSEGSSADSLLAWGPDLLLTGSSENLDSFAFALTELARQQGIPNVGAVDARVNAAFRFRGRSDAPLTYAPDFLLVPDTGTQQEFVRLGFAPEKISVCGHPHYDRVSYEGQRLLSIGRPALRRSLGLPEHTPLILFAAEISDGLEPAQYQRGPDYTLNGRGSLGRTEVVLEELLEARQAWPKAEIVLRLHPKNQREAFSAYVSELVQVCQGGDSLPWILACDAVIGMSSMLLLEAWWLNQPVLAVLPRESERAWLPDPGIPAVTTRPELLHSLSRIALAETQARSLPPAGATPRVLDALWQIVNQASRTRPSST